MWNFRHMRKGLKMLKSEKESKLKVQTDIFRQNAMEMIERNNRQKKSIIKLTGQMKDIIQKETDFYGLEMNMCLFIEHFKQESLLIKAIMDFFKIDYLLVILLVGKLSIYL
jgi:hypothetical protein